jgi:hypothetical protein
MNGKQERGLPARRAEKRLVKMVGEAARRDGLNPERVDCPSSDAVNAVVVRRLSYPDFDNVVDHIATCAPCLEEYNRLRNRYRLRKAGAVVLACAGLLFLGLFWSRGLLKQHRANEPVAKEAPAPVLTAILDYTNWTTERSDQSRPQPVEVPRLSRASLDLTIKLPLGTEDGIYTVQFRSSSDEPVAEAVGTLAWNGTAEALKIRTDLRNVPAGTYTVTIRAANSTLRHYAVVLE